MNIFKNQEEKEEFIKRQRNAVEQIIQFYRDNANEEDYYQI